MNCKWRLLKLEVGDVYTQMAIDEAIMQACIENKAPNTIRFYMMEKPAITIGCNQDKDLFDNQKYEVAKRLTGGTAVFHKNDLLYAVIAGENDLPGDIEEIYRYLGDALVKGLNYSGIPATFRCNKKSKGQEICYLNDNPYDIVVFGKKISGNAQARKKGVILQHGTIIFENNYEDLKDLFLPEMVSEYQSKTTYLQKFNLQIRQDEVCENLIKSFSNILSEKNINLIKGSLTDYEKKLVKMALGVDKC